MSIFDRFKRGSGEAGEPVVPADGTAPDAPDAPETPAQPSGPETEAPPTAAEPSAVASAPVSPDDAGETMPLPLDEIQAALATADAVAASWEAGAAPVPETAPVLPPSGPLAPERLAQPDDLPFLARRAQVIPDRHGDPMESMGNIFDVAILLAVGFLVVSLSSFGLSDLLGKGDVTIVKNPGGKNMELVTKTNGKISIMRTTTQQAEGIGAAIGTVYKLENGEIVWVPGLPGAGGRTTGTTGATPSTPTSGTYAPPLGTATP